MDRRERIAEIVYSALYPNAAEHFPFHDPCAPTEKALEVADAIIALPEPPEVVDYDEAEVRRIIRDAFEKGEHYASQIQGFDYPLHKGGRYVIRDCWRREGQTVFATDDETAFRAELEHLHRTEVVVRLTPLFQMIAQLEAARRREAAA